VAGVLLLGWLLYRIGPGNLARNLSEIGWGFLLILALRGLPIVLNTLSWQRLLPENSGVHLMRLAPILVAGDAVNTVNPVSVVGGELVRASLLRRALPAQTAVVSVALAAMSQFVAQILFALSGLPVAWSLIADARLRRAMLVLGGVMVLCLGFVLFLGFSTGGLAWIKGVLGRVRWLRARWAALPERWRSLEREARNALRERPGAFAESVGAAFLGWQAGVVEAFVILRFLREPVGWGQAFAIEALAVVIEGLLFFVPAKIGAQEGGKVLIFLAMGLPPAKGFALGFIRRLRELAWAVAGLAVLAHYQRR
jgi:glycosyltransferase 2 family protein